MTALLTFLAGKAATWFVGAAVIIAAFVATYVKGRLSGASRERDKQAAKEAEARANEIDRIKRAAGAAPSVGVQQDPHNRDNQP